MSQTKSAAVQRFHDRQLARKIGNLIEGHIKLVNVGTDQDEKWMMLIDENLQRMQLLHSHLAEAGVTHEYESKTNGRPGLGMNKGESQEQIATDRERVRTSDKRIALRSSEDGVFLNRPIIEFLVSNGGITDPDIAQVFDLKVSAISRA